MNRRNFLARIAAATAGAAALLTDPERLLWTPGAKSFFIPEKPRLANTREAADLALGDWTVNVQTGPSHISGSARMVEALIGGEKLIEDPHRYTLTLSASRMYGVPRRIAFDTNWEPLGPVDHTGQIDTAHMNDARAAAIKRAVFGDEPFRDVSMIETNYRVTRRTPAGLRTFLVGKEKA